jgi:hypothetical protein
VVHHQNTTFLSHKSGKSPSINHHIISQICCAANLSYILGPKMESIGRFTFKKEI